MISLNNFVSAWGTYYGEYDISYRVTWYKPQQVFSFTHCICAASTIRFAMFVVQGRLDSDHFDECSQMSTSSYKSDAYLTARDLHVEGTVCISQLLQNLKHLF